MKKIKKIVLVFLLILALIIQHFHIADVFRVSGSGNKTLAPGDYMYMNTAFSGRNWSEDNADIVLYYEPTSGSWKYKVFEYWDKLGLYKVKVPDDINTSGKFLFARVSHGSVQDDSTTWVEPWNKTGDLYYSNIPDNSNTFRITDWGTGEWVADTWNISNFGGETLYFYNCDYRNTILTEVRALFYESETSASSTIQMSLVSDNLWSVTIPEGYDYNMVSFYNANSELLADVEIMNGDFDPGGDNTKDYMY